MPAFVSTYSAAQRQRLFEVVIDGGMSARKALDAAAAGELGGLGIEDQRGLGGMSYGHACDLIREERIERNGISSATAHPAKIAREIGLRLLVRAKKDAARIADEGLKSPMNAEAAAKTVKVTRDILALLRDLDAGKANGNAKGTSSGPVKAQSLAARIAAGADPETGEPPLPTETSTTAEAREPHATTHTTATDNTDAGAVRSPASRGDTV